MPDLAPAIAAVQAALDALATEAGVPTTAQQLASIAAERDAAQAAAAQAKAALDAAQSRLDAAREAYADLNAALQ